jgi:hypothetical protein
MVQQFLPHLKTRKGALIVNVSSGLAFVPFANVDIPVVADVDDFGVTPELDLFLAREAMLGRSDLVFPMETPPGRCGS